jgi:hypothetical protein
MKIVVTNNEMESVRKLLVAYGCPEEIANEKIEDEEDNIGKIHVDSENNIYYDIDETFNVDFINLLIKTGPIIKPIIDSVRAAVKFFKVDMNEAYIEFKGKWFKRPENHEEAATTHHTDNGWTLEKASNYVPNDNIDVINESCNTIAK